MTLYAGMGYGIKCGKLEIKGKMWRVVRSLYVNNSCIFLEGKSSKFLPIKQGVAQGCTLLPTLKKNLN